MSSVFDRPHPSHLCSPVPKNLTNYQCQPTESALQIFTRALWRGPDPHRRHPDGWDYKLNVICLLDLIHRLHPFIQRDVETCLFAPVPWWYTLWLDVVYVSVCMCVWRGGHLEERRTILMLSGWNIAALSLDCCVRCFSPIHKNAIPCSTVPDLTK